MNEKEMIKKIEKAQNGEKYIFKDIKKFYAAYDRAAEVYLSPFMATTDLKAIRMLEETMKEPNSPIAKHPEDYRIDCVFEMDMRTGKIVSNEKREIIEAKLYKE